MEFLGGVIFGGGVVWFFRDNVKSLFAAIRDKFGGDG